MATDSGQTALGTPAPDFDLPTADGTGNVSLADVCDSSALLVAFLSNHCPYVRHIERALGEFAAEYSEKGLAVVGICSNDVENYPEDAPEEMAGQIQRAGFGFPYLYDESQEVAHAFGAVCTPDFFLYDGGCRLAYRGQFDDSRPHSAVTPTGETLRAAADAVLRGETVPAPHPSSVGCSIKWKPGNEPKGRFLG
jgi:peroxiredoxin